MKNLLMKVVAMRQLAAQWGFVYPSVWQHLAALRGEVDELTEEVNRRDCLDDGASDALIMAEMGDVIFTACAIAHSLGHSPEECLRIACDKFERRFKQVITLAKEDGFSAQMPPTMSRFNQYWNLAKKEENHHA